MSFPRVAVIGAGGLSGKQIYPNLAQAGLKLVAACDLDLAKAKARCEQYGGEAYDDIDTMLAQAELDGVIICVGPEFHCAGALKMLEAGLPVYTEKPPAVCAADLLPVVELAREKNLIAMTAMKKRYAKVYQRAKAFIDSPEFGHPQHLHMYRVCHVQYDNKTPRSDHLLDYGVHNIDVVAWLFGEVETVRAAAVDKTVFQIELRFANGALGGISFVQRPGCTPLEDLHLTGTEGWMATTHQSGYRIGQGKQIQTDVYHIEIEPGDRFLICSDGVTKTMQPEELARLINECDTPEQFVNGVITLGNNRGGPDNITAIALFAEPAPEHEFTD